VRRGRDRPAYSCWCSPGESGISSRYFVDADAEHFRWTTSASGFAESEGTPSGAPTVRSSSGTFRPRWSYFFWDGYHPNAQGVAFIADKTAGPLAALLAERPPRAVQAVEGEPRSAR